MDKAIFQFHADYYDREEVETFTRNLCEKLCNTDEDNVTKFDISAEDSLQDILNENYLDVDNCFYRVFI